MENKHDFHFVLTEYMKAEDLCLLFFFLDFFI